MKTDRQTLNPARSLPFTDHLGAAATWAGEQLFFGFQSDKNAAVPGFISGATIRPIHAKNLVQQ
jgi:hypothetical protein